jgi:hypothetical protein
MSREDNQFLSHLMSKLPVYTPNKFTYQPIRVALTRRRLNSRRSAPLSELHALGQVIASSPAAPTRAPNGSL